MERKPPSKADRDISELGLWESEIAFGPHREAQPDEKYDPEDLTSGHKLIPIRKYGPGLDQNEAPQPNGRGIFSPASSGAESLRSETSSLTRGLTPGVFAKGDKSEET